MNTVFQKPLTEQEQRQLTEVLGECWHEQGANWRCASCGVPMPLQQELRLDFTDWLVVGRLIEKVQKTHSIHISSVGQSKNCWHCVIGYQRPYRFSSIMQSTPQEAICRAVLARLEGEKP